MTIPPNDRKPNWGHGGAVVTHLSPINEGNDSKPISHVGKLEVVYSWSAVYSTET